MIKSLFGAAAITLVLLAQPALADDIPAGKIVSFTADDGTTLSGIWRGASDHVVVLSHQYDIDQSGWDPLVGLLDQAGYATLTYNFRGYPPSGGDPVISELQRDLDAAVAYAREQGATHIALVGASMGGIATVPAAVTLQPDAYVTISAPVGFAGLDATDEALQASTAPKLFINSEGDAAAADTRHMAEVAAEPKAVSFYPSSLHGMRIFSTKSGPKLLDEIVSFIEANMPL